MKTVYLIDPVSQLFSGIYIAQESPLEPGQFVTPIYSTDMPPPEFPPSKAAKWTGETWELVDALPSTPEYVPTLDEIKEQAKSMVRVARKPVFYTLAGMQSEALAKGDSATATAIVTIQQALKDLPDIDLTECTTAEQVAAAFVQSWSGIKALAPAHVASAFNEVLAP